MTVIKTDRESQENALEAVRKAGSWTAGVIGVGSGKSRAEKIVAFKKSRETARKHNAAAA